MAWMYLFGVIISGHYLWKRAHGQWAERWLAPKEKQWMHDLVMVCGFVVMVIALLLSVIF